MDNFAFDDDFAYKEDVSGLSQDILDLFKSSVATPLGVVAIGDWVQTSGQAKRAHLSKAVAWGLFALLVVGGLTGIVFHQRPPTQAIKGFLFMGAVLGLPSIIFCIGNIAAYRECSGSFAAKEGLDRYGYFLTPEYFVCRFEDADLIVIPRGSVEGARCAARSGRLETAYALILEIEIGGQIRELRLYPEEEEELTAGYIETINAWTHKPVLATPTEKAS